MTVPNPIVTFDLSGRGAAIAPKEAVFRTAIAAPAEPTASGYAFDGWYTDAGLTTLADFSMPITADTALFAGWTEVAATDAEPMLAETGSSAPLLPIGVLSALCSRQESYCDDGRPNFRVDKEMPRS